MKAYCIIFFFLISVGIIFPNSYTEYLTEGDKLYSKFDNFGSLKNYEKAYELAPDDYDVLLRLTRTYNAAGEELKELHRRDEAESYITKGLKFAEIFKSKYPDSAAVYAYLALSYGQWAMYVGGEEKIKLAHKIRDNAAKAIKMNSNDYLPYIILGIYNREIASLSWFERLFANTFFGDVPEGSLEQSEKLFQQALNIRTNMVVATYQLAKTYREMENETKEKEFLRKVLKLPNEDFRDKYAKEKSKKRLADL